MRQNESGEGVTGVTARGTVDTDTHREAHEDVEKVGSAWPGDWPQNRRSLLAPCSQFELPELRRQKLLLCRTPRL